MKKSISKIVSSPFFYCSYIFVSFYLGYSGIIRYNSKVISFFFISLFFLAFNDLVGLAKFRKTINPVM